MKKYLFFFFILCSLSAFCQGNLQKGLMAYYNFDSSPLNDLSGRGHNGTKSGSVSIVNGIKGKAYFFDGTSYISVPNQSDLNVGKKGSMSISIWFKIDSTDTDRSKPRVLIGKRISASTNSDYILFSSGGKICWGTGAASDTNAWMTFAEPSLNKWHHIVATLKYTSSSSTYFKSVYMDGTLVKSGTTSVKNDSVTNDMRIAEADIGSGTAYFDGAIDEVRIYNRALSTSEILALYKFSNINDAGLTKNANYKSVCNGVNSISLSLKNFGFDSLYNCNIHCLINGSALPAYAWSGTLAPDSTYSNLIMDSFNFKVGKSYIMKVWTSKPNGLKDDDNTNDTVVYYLTVNSLPHPNAGKDKSVCFGQSDTLGSKSSPGSLYSWKSIPSGFNSKVSNPVVLPVTNTFYIFTEADSLSGCSNSDTINIKVNALPNPKWTYSNFGSSYFFIPYDTTLVSYLWSFGDANTSALTKPSHTYAASSKNYVVKLYVEDSNHCNAEFDNTLSVITSLDNSLSIGNFVYVYPNPVSNILNIKLSNIDSKSASFRMYNTIGQTVFETNLITNINEFSLDVSEFKAGIYFIEVKSNEYFLQKKIIIK